MPYPIYKVYLDNLKNQIIFQGWKTGADTKEHEEILEIMKMPYIFIMVDGYLGRYICKKYSDMRNNLFSLTYISVEESFLKINSEAK